ncbi:MAG: hypothetical protein GX333_10000 [Syntrophomonadaceae bacterium]|nr:hypothetical protein [Syntrophomonadaceae bacterium]
MEAFHRAKGVLIGLATADALGALVEFIPSKLVKSLPIIKDFNPPIPLAELITKADNEKTLNSLQLYIDNLVLPGLYTDDTQQAILLAYSLINNKGVNVAHIANLFVEGAKSSNYGDFGIFRHAGPGFITTVKNLIQYKSIENAAPITAGNGAAMRIAPLGVFYHQNIDKLLRATIEVSALTHQDIRGITAAGIVSYSIAYLFKGTPSSFNSQDYLYNLHLFVEELENTITADYKNIQSDKTIKHQVSKGIRLITDISNTEEKIALKALDNYAQKTSHNENVRYNSPFALGSVIYSLYLFIKYGLDWETAVIIAVNSGGDTDTIAAILSSLCGALHGYKKIPKNWINKVYNIDSLERLAESLITLEPITLDLIEIENNLSKMEHDYRKHYKQLLKQSIGYR